MKILHFADLHLGVESYGRTNPATGFSTRFEDFLAAFDHLVDYAIENKVDLVLFCGDTYKTRDPSPTQQREFARRLSRLAGHCIPVFLLIGNHDVPSTSGRATTTEIFATLELENVYVSSRPEVKVIKTPGGTIQVASLPWLRRSVLLSKEITKDMNLKQVNEKLQEILAERIDSLVAKLDPKIPAVLAAHVSISDAQIRAGTEQTMVIGQDHFLLKSNIARREFDYVALGHIHRHQVLVEEPPVVYSGSLERLDFGDEDDEKGFYVVDISPDTEKRKVNYRFQPVQARHFLSIKAVIDIADIDPTASAIRTIQQYGDAVRGAIVQLKISVPAQVERLLRDSDLRTALKEASFYTITRDIIRESRPRLSHLMSTELSRFDALKAYLEYKQTPPEHMKVLLEYGRKMVEER